MPFFDLHCHPGLKTLFKPQDGTQLSAWHTIPSPIILGTTLASQCSLQQLTANNNVPLLCMTIHPPESGMINQFLIKLGASTVFSSLMDSNRLQQMYSGADGYQVVFAEELSNIMAGPRPDDNIPNGTQVKFLQNWADYDPTQAGTMHTVFNIEGGHALYSTADKPGTAQEAIDNLKAFLDKGYLTLYLTPTHLTPNEFVNHAYGNKILTKGPLLPVNLGITPDGKALIDYAYSQGLLIDIKHMSYLSRQQFYYIRQKYYADKPIIASHVGVTGCDAYGGNANFLGWSTDQHIQGNVVALNGDNNRGLLAGTAFYPLSINLFNDDIVAVLKSGGLIGLSMDIRIVGGTDNDEALQTDYISIQEYPILKMDDPDRTNKIQQMADALWDSTAPDQPALTQQDDPDNADEIITAEMNNMTETEAGSNTGPNSQLHARYLANQLLQIRFVADMNGLPPPWDQVCIGSDFDGLIQPVDCCWNVTALDNMAQQLEQELAAGAQALGVTLTVEPGQIVQQFCYTNAYNFLNKHFAG